MALLLAPRAPRAFAVASLAACLLGFLSAACVGSTSSGGANGGGPDPGLDASCGLAPVTGQDGGIAYVSDAGVVTFAPVSLGTTVEYAVAVQDSAYVSETIMGATVTGSGAEAFQVLSAFPMNVPAGQPALVQVAFTPRSPGDFEAQLVLQTAKMGPSPVLLSGTGIDADAGAGGD